MPTTSEDKPLSTLEERWGVGDAWEPISLHVKVPKHLRNRLRKYCGENHVRTELRVTELLMKGEAWEAEHGWPIKLPRGVTCVGKKYWLIEPKSTLHE
jgi:hypothetical protein